MSTFRLFPKQKKARTMAINIKHIGVGLGGLAGVAAVLGQSLHWFTNNVTTPVIDGVANTCVATPSALVPVIGAAVIVATTIGGLLTSSVSPKTNIAAVKATNPEALTEAAKNSVHP